MVYLIVTQESCTILCILIEDGAKYYLGHNLFGSQPVQGLQPHPRLKNRFKKTKMLSESHPLFIVFTVAFFRLFSVFRFPNFAFLPSVN